MHCTSDQTDLNEAVKMTKKEAIDVFSSKIIHAQTKAMFLGSNLHMMMWFLEVRWFSLASWAGCHEYLY